MHIKHIRTMIEKLADCALCELEKGADCVDTEEFGCVVDMIKDLTDAEYKARISRAMEKSEEEDEAEERYMLKRFKEEYGDEDSKRYYDEWRYKSGHFAPKGSGTRRGFSEPNYHMTPEYKMSVEDYKSHTPEYYRDVDRAQGRLYYAETGMGMDNAERMNTRPESKVERARRGYVETKEMHNDNSAESKQKRMKELEAYMNELNEDIKGFVRDMSAEEKTMLKQKIAKLGTLV